MLREFYEPFKAALDAAQQEMEPARAEPSEYTCEECGKPMWIRQSRRGKFLGCSAYPKCKSTQELPAGVAGQ